MYFSAAIALAVLAFTEGTFGAPSRDRDNNNRFHCPRPSTVTVTVTHAAPTPTKPAETAMPPNNGHTRTAKAVYFITNADHNSVVSIPIDSNGLLTGKASLTATGGRGLSGRRADGTPAAPDSLFSQDALTVVNDLLFAVNAGSNTLSLFKISDDNACLLTPIGSPQSTGGEFPIAVTYSDKLNTACVVNGGAIDGVSCFSVSRRTGLSPLDASPRRLGISQMTPAVAGATVSDIHFTTDSSSLLVTVKGNAATNITGFLAVYPVVDHRVSQVAVKSTPQGTGVLFGAAPLDANRIIVADPSFGGAAVLTINPASNDVSTASLITAVNSSAICWVAYAPRTGSAYLTDAAQNRVVEVDTATGEIVKTLQLVNDNIGMFDSVVGGDFFYALSPRLNRTSIAVMDISGGRGSIKEVQNFEIVGLEGMGSAMGMQVFPREV